MEICIGIDMGISSTKVAVMKNNEIIRCRTVVGENRNNIYNIINLLVKETVINPTTGFNVCTTGVKSISPQNKPNIEKVSTCDEFTACVLGAKYRNPFERFIIAGFGTGTPFIMVDGKESRHIGGFGIGGGTLTGLAKLLIGNINIEELSEMAAKGDPAKVNLLIKDICNEAMPGLPLDTTASNFGKTDTEATKEDIAAGLIRLVIETIGSAANLASQICNIKDIIAIGRLATLGTNRVIFDALENLYNIKFHVPEYAGYRTAIGAALYADLNNDKI